MTRLLALAAVAAVAAVQSVEDPMEGEAAEEKPSADSHVVEAGDTLWALAGRYMDSSFRWPELWAWNPEISNPHWIYPGDVIRFYPSQLELPSRADLVAGRMEVPAETEPPKSEVLDDEAPAVEIVRTPLKHTVSTRRHFVGLFVTQKQLAESGTLVNAVDDKILLSARDSVFVNFPGGDKPKAGSRYLLYRTLGRVVHPLTGKKYGYMTQITGVASMQSQERAVSRARIDTAVTEVERGHFVTPLVNDPFTEVKPKPTAKEVEGVVLAVEFDGGVVAGEEQVVFIDKGTNEGLERGNLLNVVSPGDPLTGRHEGLPETIIGRLVILAANDNASTCLVVNAVREIEPGTKVVTVKSIDPRARL